MKFDTDYWSYVSMVVWLVTSLGLFIDRYFFMQQRWVESMLEDTKRKGRCIVCKRPMIIKESAD